MTSILMLEDDKVIAQEIATYLEAKQYACTCVFDGSEFLAHANPAEFEVYLLDIQVPKLNGLDVCKQIRKHDAQTPILILTAYGDIQDKKEAFERGADDYLVKPFLLEELDLRIQSLLRRKQITQTESEVKQIDDLIINFTEKWVKRQGQEIKLTAKEFQLLGILFRYKGRIVSKRQIAEELWDNHISGNENTIEVYINFLRNKIDKPFGKPLLHTKIGFGYFLKASS